MLRSLRARLLARLFRSRHEAELDEELRYHLDREIERNRAAGMPPGVARATALRAFGRITAHQEGVREAWRWLWIDDLGQDLVFAFRSFRREPTLVLTVMLTIGLAVGLNAAAFTLFNAYVLRPAPVRDPASLQAISWNSQARRRSRRRRSRPSRCLNRSPYLGGGAVVLLACGFGALVPSRRAARIEPLEAIRAD